MTTDQWILTGIAGIVVGAFTLVALKGLVKLLLLAAAVIGGGLAYYMLNTNGYSYLSFLTSSPRPWMVTVISVLGGLFVFFTFFSALRWFNRMFSWGTHLPGGRFGGKYGIMMTFFVTLVVGWLLLIGVYYFGSISDLKRYKLLAEDRNSKKSVPLLSQWKNNVDGSSLGHCLKYIDPMRDPERLKLAKLITYIGSLSTNETQLAHLNVMLNHFPYMQKVRKASCDKGTQDLLGKDDFSAILNDPKLTKILSDDKVRFALKHLDVDYLYGISTKRAESEAQ